MKRTILAYAAISLAAHFSAGAPACRAADAAGHHFGKWPAINAIIHDEKQKNLNLDDKDFLMEVWLKPLPKLKYKGDSSSSLICKKGYRGLSGYDLAYSANGDLGLTLCDRRRELEGDAGWSAGRIVMDNEWY